MRGRGISRRTVLAAGAVGVAAVAVAPSLLQDEVQFFRDILLRRLGRFEIPDGEFRRFVADVRTRIPVPNDWEGALLGLTDYASGLVGTAVPASIARRIERMERLLLAEFMLATGLTDLPHGRRLSYHGLFSDQACANPYARFDPT